MTSMSNRGPKLVFIGLVVALGLLGFLLLTPDTRLPRTDPKTWSEGGWHNLRWGMGPGDVELILRSASGELESIRVERLPAYEKAPPGQVESNWVRIAPALDLAGRPCMVRLGFYRDTLYSVAILADFPGKAAEADDSVRKQHTIERHAWRDKIADLLQTKYGRFESSERGPIGWTRTLRTSHSTVTIVASDDYTMSPDRRIIAISYADPIRAHLIESGVQKDLEKL